MPVPDRGTRRRLKFYGPHNWATPDQADRAAHLLASFAERGMGSALDEVLEMANARLFADRGLLPTAWTEEQRSGAYAQTPHIDAAIGRYFGSISSDTISDAFDAVSYYYRADLLDALGRYGVYRRVPADVVLPVLDRLGLTLGELLQDASLVVAYGSAVRTRILADERGGEWVVRKHLARDERHPIHMPRNLTVEDARVAIDTYLTSAEPNINVVRLVVNAAPSRENGVDSKLKVKARRRLAELTQQFFEHNAWFKTGVSVEFSESQTVEDLRGFDDLVATYSYSQRWLLDGLDFPTVLNNFVHLFEYANDRMLLTLPSFTNDFSVIERVSSGGGKTDYVTGLVFGTKDQASLLQLAMYDRFLASNDVHLEDVLVWFFDTYLPDYLGVGGIRFAPSTRAATYRERCTHLFIELERVASQFRMWVEDGEVDDDLVAMAGGVTYKTIPSVIEDKYAYIADGPTIGRVLHLLFSDQSMLGYISEGLSADNVVQLIACESLAPSDFLDYQTDDLDFLYAHDILETVDGTVTFANVAQIAMLQSLWEFEALNCHHYDHETRLVIDDMAARGWLRKSGTLLTESEGRYFNYLLNNAEFHNGPALRNRYVHGPPAGPGNSNLHFQNYLVALRTLLCLVIKINDDLWLQVDDRDATMPSTARLGNPSTEKGTAAAG